MIAEVSDKLPPMTFFWCFHLLAAAVVLVLTLLSKRRAALVVLLPLTIAWATFFIHDSLVGDDPLRDAVVQEMGMTYFVQQTVTALLPALAVMCGILMARMTSRSSGRGFPVQV